MVSKKKSKSEQIPIDDGLIIHALFRPLLNFIDRICSRAFEGAGINGPLTIGVLVV